MNEVSLFTGIRGASLGRPPPAPLDQFHAYFTDTNVAYAIFSNRNQTEASKQACVPVSVCVCVCVCVSLSRLLGRAAMVAAICLLMSRDPPDRNALGG